MSNNGNDGSGFWKAAEPILRRFVENIESPFVWTPLGLFILCVLAYPLSQFQPFLYLAILFLLLALTADWVGRLQNRQTPAKPSLSGSSYRDEIFRYLSGVQSKAVDMLAKRKLGAARALIERNLQAVDEALKSFPEDADFHALMGYTLKDVYQSSRNLLPKLQRQAYLNRARSSFENVLKLDPNSASAHNGMGNVLFFEGRFDEAIKEHEKAIALTGNKYPAAEHDRNLVLSVKSGKIPFGF